jgi:hypothetical protein
MLMPHRKHLRSLLRAQQVNAIYRFVRWFINIIVTIVNSIHRHVFYLKHATDNVRTSQETPYVSATSPTG